MTREEAIQMIFHLWEEMEYTEKHRKYSMRKWLGYDRLDHPHAPVKDYARYLNHKLRFRRAFGVDNTRISDEKLEEMLRAELQNPIAEGGILRRLTLLYEERGWRRWRREREMRRQKVSSQSTSLGEVDWGI